MHARMQTHTHISVRNNFEQLRSNFSMKIATQITNWVAICNN